MGLNLCEVFRQMARRQPDHPALLGPGPGEGYTYAALNEAIRQAGERLLGAGVHPGACVGLYCRSGASYIIATYAAWQAGACVVPIAVELTRPEREHILRTIALDYVIAPTTPTRSVSEATTPTSFLAPHQRARETELWPGMAVYPVARLRDHPPGFASIHGAFVRFTSGTTAAAKGVVLSHQTIYERISAANEVLQLGPRDRVVWLLSMAYHFAVSIVAYLSFGAGIILLPHHFAQAILTAGHCHKGTMIYGSPTHFAWLATAPSPDPWPELRLAISTTATLDRTTADQFHARFGIPVAQALGIIEVGLPFINLAHAAQHPQSVGKALPAYQVRLEDVGLGEGLRELLLRGPGCLDAYYDPWAPRSAIMPDGWFRTGDVAEVNADGCVFLRGRLKEVINVLGMKFFPQEVEAVLTSHPAIESACVFARPDPDLGEVPHAQVVLKAGASCPTESELIAYCEKQLALFKVPRRVEFVTALSRTASGKVLHRPAQVSP
jgi:long-chain acyl-CoA synthetase